MLAERTLDRNFPDHKAIPPAAFYKNNLRPPLNPYAESDARTQAAVEKAVGDALREWNVGLTKMHRMMVRKRLATGLQLPTLSKSPDKYWMKVQVEGITAVSAK